MTTDTTDPTGTPDAPAGPAHAAPRTPQLFGTPLVWGVLVLALLVGAVVAWRTPAETSTPEARPYTATYKFDYGAPLTPNPVYETPTVGFGDPLFLAIVDAVDTTVDYEITNGIIAIGEAELVTRVVVESSAGWSRIIAETPVQRFTGHTATGAVRVNFADALAVANEVNAVTGTSGSLQVKVVATVDAGGEVLIGDAPGPLESVTNANITFDLTPTVAKLVEGKTADTEAGGGSPFGGNRAGGVPTAGASEASGRTGTLTPDAIVGLSPEEQLEKRKTRTTTQFVPTEAFTPATVSVAMFSVPITTLRTVLTALAAVAGAFGLLSLAVAIRARNAGEHVYIAARYGKRISEAATLPDGADRRAIDVATIDDVLEAAADAEVKVLHYTGDGGHAYYAFDGPNVYRYRTQGA